jgi:uncharacterized protein YoxC
VCLCVCVCVCVFTLQAREVCLRLVHAESIQAALASTQQRLADRTRVLFNTEKLLQDEQSKSEALSARVQAVRDSQDALHALQRQLETLRAQETEGKAATEQLNQDFAKISRENQSLRDKVKEYQKLIEQNLAGGPFPRGSPGSRLSHFFRNPYIS